MGGLGSLFIIDSILTPTPPPTRAILSDASSALPSHPLVPTSSPILGAMWSPSRSCGHKDKIRTYGTRRAPETIFYIFMYFSSAPARNGCSGHRISRLQWTWLLWYGPDKNGGTPRCVGPSLVAWGNKRRRKSHIPLLVFPLGSLLRVASTVMRKSIA